MKFVLATALLGAALSACGTYVSPDSDANYDAIKAATEQCQSKDGHLQLKSGYEGRRLSDYECKSGEVR